MIFLSHNAKDKPFVEPIALRLYEIFGRDRVFYDSWSIQPGDGIFDKINSGLERCKYFFLFVTKNSLKSQMVRFEWQNALFQSAIGGDLKIIPVRSDVSAVPPTLGQTLYLDLYSNGLETVLGQMVDVIENRNTFNPQYSDFSNLRAVLTPCEGGYAADIIAEHFMEPSAGFRFFMRNRPADIALGAQNSEVIQTACFAADGIGRPGESVWTLQAARPIAPGVPLSVFIRKRAGTHMRLIEIMHERSKNVWNPIRFVYQE